MILMLVIVTVFCLNLPFGYWRDSTRKFSLPWVLAIHLPVPAVVALRVYSGLGWHLYTFPLIVTAFFAGQYLGARLHTWMNAHGVVTPTGCLVMDLYHSLRQ
jgi:hypothetical protein